MFWNRKKKAEEPVSSISWTKERDHLFKIVIRGRLNSDEFVALQAAAAKEINAAGTVCGLLVLEDFIGWGDEVPDNLDFLLQYDPQIKKIAVVGEPEHKDGAMMFMGAGYRKAQVKFFEPSEMQGAEEWLRE